MLASRRRIFHLFLIGLILYWVFLVVATHIPEPELPNVFDLQDKALHIVAYAVLSFLAVGAYRLCVGREGMRRGTIVGILCLIAVHAALDEMTQPFFGRQADFFDWCADMLGIVVGIPAVEVVSRCIQWWNGSVVAASNAPVQ